MIPADQNVQNTTTDQSTTHRLIETITYLASLVSEPAKVDPMLDTLRNITAQQGANHALTANDQAQLLKLQGELKEFLIHRDPIRSFTPESLEAEIAAHMDKSKSHTYRPLLISLGLLVVTYLAGVLLAPGSLSNRLLLPSPLVAAYLNGAIAVLFWLARKDFVVAIRKVYTYFSAATLLGTLGAIQFPFLFAIPDLAQLAPFKYIGFMVPFPLMCALFYAGARLYLKQLGIQKYFWSLPRVLIGVVLVGGTLIAAPHAVKVPEEFFFDLSLVSIGLSSFLCLATASLCLKAGQHMTVRYARGMKLFSISLLFLVGACAYAVATLFVTGPTSSQELAIAALPFTVSGVLQLVSAYFFKKNRA